ncbi:MAG: hypothetical protein V4541_09070 [Bacteroidota bacterium]
MGDDKHIAFKERLLELLYNWVPLTPSFRISLKALLHLQHENPKTILLNPPKHASRAWFSLDCFVVAYTYDESGNLNVVRIYMPNDIFTDLSSFFQDRPAKLKLTIIQGNELLYIKKEDFNTLKIFPETFDLVQHIMLVEQDLEAWRVWIMTLKDEQKVHEFSLRYPMNLLPNHLCASFLQMTQSRYSAEKAFCNRSDWNS